MRASSESEWEDGLNVQCEELRPENRWFAKEFSWKVERFEKLERWRCERSLVARPGGELSCVMSGGQRGRLRKWIVQVKNLILQFRFWVLSWFKLVHYQRSCEWEVDWRIRGRVFQCIPAVGGWGHWRTHWEGFQCVPAEGGLRDGFRPWGARCHGSGDRICNCN